MPGTVQKLTKSDWLLLGGLAASSLLEALIVARYPGDGASVTAHVGLGLLGELLILGVAAFLVWSASRRQSSGESADRSLGVTVGWICGCAWVVEISFNNFVDPKLSTGSARFYFDNGAWALISIAILVSAFVRTLRAGRIGAGIGVGLWSGLTSGLVSCLMGLLLVTLWMRFLLRDPLNIGEYAVRGAAEHSPDMATYFAYETMTGALGHLIVIGIMMSVFLGIIGALGARVVRVLQPRKSLSTERSASGRTETGT